MNVNLYSFSRKMIIQLCSLFMIKILEALEKESIIVAYVTLLYKEIRIFLKILLLLSITFEIIFH